MAEACGPNDQPGPLEYRCSTASCVLSPGTHPPERCLDAAGLALAEEAINARPSAQRQPADEPRGPEADRKPAYRFVADAISAHLAWPHEGADLRDGVRREVLHIRDSMLAASLVPLTPQVEEGE